MSNPREALRAASEDRLQSMFTAAYGSAVPIEFDNVRFNQPTDKFISHYIMYVSTPGRMAIGTTIFNRFEGFVCLEVHVKENTGTRDLNLMCDALCRIYDSVQLTLGDGSNVTFNTPMVIGESDKRSGYVSYLVMVPFWLEACVR